MKKLIYVIVVVCLFSACSSERPREVAKNFTENVAKGKIEEAKRYASESTEELLDLMIRSGAVDINPDFTFNFVKESIEGDQAWVMYTDENGVEGIIPLSRYKKQWKVDIQYEI